ncbi:MAG: hypothetical protein KKB30_12640 [Proteobacteria bacterium]|nr:hypothetical protein [Pseudomonadota bacterium]MBU1714639.1 hypothetical protein [Pseudomonadota bacterium]
MMKFDFDAELRGADGAALPVYCEVQPPYVGSQKSLIRVAVPAQHITENPPGNPCALSGRSGAFTINMQGIHWRRFPTSSKGSLGLETIELLHIERLTILHHPANARREIRFHLAPISYLRSESSCVYFGDKSHSEELFGLDLPDLGATRFVAEWVTVYHRDAEIPGATVLAGFSAVAGLPPDAPIDADRMVAKFRSTLEVLSVLFRQAVSLHGWTYTDGETVSTWVDPLEPNVTPSAREGRGDFVAKPQIFVECATRLAHAHEKADVKTRSLVRHLSVAVNPFTNSRTNDRYLFMFSALERVIEFAWKRGQTQRSPAVTDNAVTTLLEQLKETVVAEGGENASEISARLGGLIKVVNGTSFRDKFEAFFRVYPTMTNSCSDLWPILGSDKKRGLREVRHALAHGRGSFVSLDVVAVAEWHLAILLERVIFVLLDMTLPDGISPGSHLLRMGGKGWYERDWWVPLRSKQDQPI